MAILLWGNNYAQCEGCGHIVKKVGTITNLYTSSDKIIINSDKNRIFNTIDYGCCSYHVGRLCCCQCGEEFLITFHKVDNIVLLSEGSNNG